MGATGIPRTVICPACGAGRETKAPRSVMVSCLSCGEKFPATAPTDADIAAHGAAVPAASAPAAGTSSPKVVKAKATTVRQTARPRARGVGTVEGAGDTTAAAPEAAGVTDPPAPESPPAPAAPNGQDRAKAAGARGGRGYYGQFRRAG